MKRIISAVFALCCCIALSGCSAESKNNDFIKSYLLSDNEQYNNYLSMEKIHSDKIDTNGYYADGALAQAEADSHPGAVHVSFASNSLLNITYYTDPEHTDVIDKQNCYIYPGDSIYAQVDLTSLVRSDTYEFQGFQMAVFDGDQPNYYYAGFDGNTITIPDNIQYREISIIPNGAYKRRELTFQAEYKDIDGNTIPISPVWIINVGDQSYSTKSDGFSIDANSTFRVKARFDSDEYYLEETEPKFESYNDNTGEIVFTQYDAQKAEDNYKLIFGKKFDFSIDDIKATGPITIWIDGKKYDGDFPIITSARLGAQIQIESEGNITYVGATKNLIRLTQNGYVYSVYNESDTFEFNPASYTYSNGKVTFYDSDHRQITEKTNLNIGDVLYYIGTPDEKYTFNMGNGEQKINVDSNIDYMLKKELKFILKQKISLTQPEKGGTVTYYLNGKEITDDNAYFVAGTDKLTASFKPAERFKTNNLSDQAECIISSSDHRIRFKDNDGREIPIDKVFELSSTQKAALTVKLDASVGTEMKFNIYNGTVLTNPGKKSYIANKAFSDLKNPLGFDDSKLLDGYSIETVSGLKITISDWSPLKNEAIRIDVTKKDASNNKVNEIYYILDGGGSRQISTDSGDSTYYTNIDIAISKVTGSVFDPTKYTYTNCRVVITYDDTSSKAQLISGDFIDDSRKIRITLTAKAKYQLYQKGFKLFGEKYDPVDYYETTCKYGELDDSFSEMKSKTKVL